ncbi:hypothetical protein BOX15_Mlig025806g2 [Macrostomum lignano]|uniref:Major facilitator superfamily (MFS) profile domain-containing protein n=1 Tax=Macrostomum lignano TaxID=282301 RepID=A0A267DZL3_9PLAT|nr:hypothetical protein BOX15_Mlig025806g2 [Macrostomum lignano]
MSTESEQEKKQAEAEESKGERQGLFESTGVYARPFWAWLVLACAATNVIFLGGKRRAFGVFVAQLHVEFNQTVSLAELNWIGDSYAAVGYMTTTLSSTVILMSGRRFRIFQFAGSAFVLLACISSAYVPNPHWLFLSHTVFHGIGSSFILSVVGLIVNEYFDKQHNYHILATTLVSGGSIASIVFVQMYASLIEAYNWRNAFLVLGAIYFVVNMSGVIFFAKRPGLGDYVSNKSCVTAVAQIDRKRAPYLVLWFIDRIMTSVVTYGMLLNLADYVRRRESSLTKASYLTLLFASGEASTYLLGALITAFTRDLLHNKLKWILIGCTAVMASLLVVWELFAADRMLSNFLAFLTGFTMGPSITFLFPAGEELTSLPGHYAYPFSLAGMGVGMAISPALTALIAERNNYRWFFLIQAFMMYIKLAALIINVVLQRCCGVEQSEIDGYRSIELDSEEKRKADEAAEEAAH